MEYITTGIRGVYMQIRNSVKAVLVEGDKILLTKNLDDEGEFYLCPGGGRSTEKHFTTPC